LIKSYRKYGNNEIEYLEKNIRKFKNKNDLLIQELETDNGNVIRPLSWVLQNKKEFPEWIAKTFDKYKLTGKKISKSTNGLFKPFPYQKFVRDYMQLLSPYRGILLYHGIGTGKTCTAIQISENLKTDKNIIVLLPASLKKNFIEQGLEFCGDPQYKYNKLYEKKYSFISYNSSNIKKQIENIGSLDNHVIIIEEAHNLVSMMVSGLANVSKNGKYLYDTLMKAKNCKIIALTGTPVINSPFELAIMFNILRGYIEVSTFTYKSNSDHFDYNALKLNLEEIELVDYVNINMSNKTIEVHITVNHYTDEYNTVLDTIINRADQHSDLQLRYQEIKNKNNDPGPRLYTLFPDDNKNGDYEQFKNIFLDELDRKTIELKIKIYLKEELWD